MSDIRVYYYSVKLHYTPGGTIWNYEDRPFHLNQEQFSKDVPNMLGICWSLCPSRTIITRSVTHTVLKSTVENRASIPTPAENFFRR